MNLSWVAGWGCGPVPDFQDRLCVVSAAHVARQAPLPQAPASGEGQPCPRAGSASRRGGAYPGRHAHAGELRPLNTYLLVGIGGALGSVARYWLSLVAAAAWGVSFPWGILIINILGSFVIGFFGTLTMAADGRFAVPPDLRAFVMVGICGGFTTFSSFSLQTLDLLRDGRFGAAMANIGFSVLLCLGAVATGHYGAAALTPARVTETAEAEGPAAARPAMLLLLHRPETAPSLLSVATRLLAAQGGGRIEAMALLPTPVPPLLPDEEVMTAERRDAEGGDPRATAIALHAAMAAEPSLAGGRIACHWTEVEGDPGAVVAERAGQADLALLERPVEAGTDPMHVALHAALFGARCPVLLLPPGRDEAAPLGQVVAIAWKPDGRAERAVQAALPLLRQARRVVVLQREEDGAAMPAPPELPGLALETRRIAADARPIGTALLDEARRVGADLLVMGAYGHGEWRERLVGGATREVLAAADLPVLMRH